MDKMDKIFDVENNCQDVLKSDDDTPQGAKMARRMSRLIARRPDIVQEKPHLGKYKDAEANMKERAEHTRERHREEKPGPVHEDLEDEVKSEKLLNIGPKEHRVPSYGGGRHAKVTGEPAPSLPPSTMGKSENFIIKGKDGHVASVAVVHGNSILMGQRRDNNRWTLPGGHLETGERPHDGGRRELEEEAGIVAAKLNPLGARKITTHTGKEKTIHAFKYEVTERPKTSMSKDPDQEVHKWQWVAHKDGKLPDHVKNNLHSPKNAVLECMGLDKARFFVTDLIKGGHHKYIRKYKGKNGEWVYIYHEGETHHKLTEDDMGHHKILAEHGTEEERAYHADLLSRIQTMTDDDIGHHRLLAEHGDEDERAHHSDILKKIGHKKEEKSPMERAILEAANRDDVDQEMEPVKRDKVLGDMKREIEKTATFLAGYTTTSPFAGNIVALKSELLEAASKPKTIREVLKTAHDLAKKLEDAQGAHVSQSVGEQHKTYGQRLYSETLNSLKQHGLIPESYAREHARLPRATTHEVKNLSEHNAREVAREVARKAAEEEQDRREMGEYASKVGEVAEYFGKNFSTEEKKMVAKGIKNVFGARFSMAELDKKMNPDPNKTTTLTFDEQFLSGLMRSSQGETASFDFSIIIKDRVTGRIITYADRDIKKAADGSIQWHNQVFSRPGNDDLKKYSGMSKGLYGGVEAFLKNVTQDLPKAAKDKCRTYTYGENSGWSDHGYKGALLWAKHFFNFDSSVGAGKWREGMGHQIDQAKQKLPHLAADLESFQRKMAEFKYPYQFVKSGIFVTKDEAKRLTGNNLDFDYNQKFESSNAVDLAEIMLINSRMGLNCENHFNRTTGDAGVLNEKRAAYYQDSGARERNTAAAASPSIRSERVRRALSVEWTPAEGRSLVMTATRLREMESWSKDEVAEFYRHAPITRAAKQRVKEILDRIGG